MRRAIARTDGTATITITIRVSTCLPVSQSVLTETSLFSPAPGLMRSNFGLIGSVAKTKPTWARLPTMPQSIAASSRGTTAMNAPRATWPAWSSSTPGSGRAVIVSMPWIPWVTTSPTRETTDGRKNVAMRSDVHDTRVGLLAT